MLRSGSAWPMAAVVLMAGLVLGSLTLTGGDATIQLCAVLYVWSLVIGARSPAVAYGCAVALLLVRVSLVADLLPVDAGYLAAPYAAVLAAVAANRPAAPAGRRVATIAIAALPVAALWAAMSIGWSIAPVESAAAAAGLAVAAVLCLSARRAVTLVEVRRVVGIVAWTTVALSLAAYLVIPDTAIVVGRLRGVLENANGLAALVVVAAPLMLPRRLRWAVPAAVILVGVCVATGSRAGTVALVLALVVLAVGRCRPATRLIVVAAAGGIGLVAVQYLIARAGGLLVLRGTDSRTDAWARGLALWEQHPWLGVGAGAVKSVDSSGIGPELLAGYGLIGTAVVGAGLVAALWIGWRAAAVPAAVILGSLVDIVYEPWVYAASVYSVILWTVVCHREVTAPAGHRPRRAVQTPVPAPDPVARPVPVGRHARAIR